MDIVSRIGAERLIAVAAAIITGAAVYLMPQGVLEEAVAATGLASALPPLEPPLGSKARIGLALFAAGTAFGFIVMLIGVMGRFGPKPARKPVVARDDLPAAPRVRRRDQHPDAPARAPLSIEREIGWPDENEAAAEEPARRIRSGWDNEEHPAEQVVAEPVVVDEDEPAEEPSVFLPEADAPAVEDEIVAEPVQTSVDKPSPNVSHPSWLDVSVPQPAASQPPLSELLERLERALAARGGAAVAAAERREEPAPRAPVQAAADEESTDARLRSALESLKRFAPQRG